MDMLSGQCLCGAVSVAARPKQATLQMCNCENCRKWTGSGNLTFSAEEATATFTGPVKTISVMPHAERGFCAECGSGLFYRIVAEGPMKGHTNVSAGLFAETSRMPLGMEFFSDDRMSALDPTQPHEEMTAAQMRAVFSGT